ncbi:ABC transporter permease [Alistipes sp.]|uniref:ABC transporter permease n=1 Tax=Alistipes sp. TaxID=1872444 RepID=UPI003AEFC0AA
MRELLLEIWTSVRRNKLRTALTGFSVAWGIFMLVILLGSGNGLKNGVLYNFDDYATNSMDLFGERTSKPWMGYQKGRQITLRNNDLEILRREFPEIEDIAANTWFDGTKTVTYGKEFTKAWLRGTLPKVQRMEGIKLSAGRFINQADIEQNRKTIVIDEPMRRVLFKGGDPLGRQVNVGSSTYTVIGVQKGDAQRNSSSCFIPLTTGQLIYMANEPVVDNAILTVNGIDSDQALKDFEKRIIRRLSVEHHFAPDDESAIWISSTLEQFKNFMVVFTGINLFVWIIGLGTLLAGIVGVSNIMLVTVTERTAEFGIRKALGAKPSSIIRLILTESVLITAAFGYIGMVLGVAVMEAVNYVLEKAPANPSQHGLETIFLDPTLDLGVAVSATVVLVLAGLVAGYVPAYRAAQLKTIDALRYNK